jgi:hypothetical protein
MMFKTFIASSVDMQNLQVQGIKIELWVFLKCNLETHASVCKSELIVELCLHVDGLNIFYWLHVFFNLRKLWRV